MLNTTLGSLQEQEHQLHEKLVEQTQHLRLLRQEMETYEAAIHETMQELEQIRHKLYQVWQHSR
ncbi:MAG: hypothetical protein KC415_20775 [Anaerolineales bacterium]|nr:hypothetical protein [Anaerolineales bacterium]MCB8991733.1 hypothetical protein [Ardenticatenaceae bacterium]